MKMQDDLVERINQIAKNILVYLENIKTENITSWDLKIYFKIPSSLLYLALGSLVAQGKIRILHENLIYKIEIIKQDKKDTELNNTP